MFFTSWGATRIITDRRPPVNPSGHQFFKFSRFSFLKSFVLTRSNTFSSLLHIPEYNKKEHVSKDRQLAICIAFSMAGGTNSMIETTSSRYSEQTDGFPKHERKIIP